jgi:hypothetical protein
MNIQRTGVGPALLLLCVACEVEGARIETVGITLEPTANDGTATADDASPAAIRVRGFSVVNTDYQSVSVSLLGLDGEVLSESFVTSGSAPVGLSAPLDDIVTPSAALAGNEVLLINRTPASFLTWIDLETAEVRAQLNVETGFSSNPQDYVQVAANKAYVTRHAFNLTSGREPFDAGNDVLIVDPTQPAILGRIDLMAALDGEPAGYYPRAGRALLAGGRLRVLSLGYDETFDDAVDSRMVTIDPETDEISQVLVLEGLQNCNSLSLSPDGRQLAVGCSGPFGEDPSSGFPSSGLALLEVGDELVESRRFIAAELGGERVSSLTHAADDSVVFATFGRYDADFALAAPDRVRQLELSTGRLGDPLLVSSASAFTLGAVACVPAAGSCLVTDAELDGGVVHHFVIDDAGRLGSRRAIEVDRSVGLPPRSIGLY